MRSPLGILASAVDAGGGGGGLTVTYLGDWTDTNNLSSYSIATTLSGISTDDLIVFGIHIEGAASGLTITVNTMTAGGISGTRAVQGGTVQVADLWTVTGLSAGANTVAFTTGSQNGARATVSAWAISGGASATPTDTGTSSSDGSSSSGLSTTVDIPAGSVALAVHTAGTANASTWTGATEDYDLSPSGSSGYTGAHTDATESDRIGHTVDVAHTTSQANVLAVAVFEPSGGPPAPTPSVQGLMYDGALSTMPALTNGGALICLSHQAVSTPTAVSLNGTSATHVHTVSTGDVSTTDREVSVWWVADPPAATPSLSITWSGSTPSRLFWALAFLEDVGSAPTFTNNDYTRALTSATTIPDLDTTGDLFVACLSVRGQITFTPTYAYQDPSISVNDSNNVGLSAAWTAGSQDPCSWDESAGYTAASLIGITAA